jgi:regulator of ribonuclease activity A
MTKTADLYDQHAASLQISEPLFRDFGGHSDFSGTIATAKVFEDNSLVRATLEQTGAGRVLVVDGGGSLRCALVGDILAALAVSNGWSGIVVYGCIRDAAEIATLPIGLKALNTCPAKSVKRGRGQLEVPVRFAGIDFQPGHYLYADLDGIAVAPARLD